MGLQKPAITGPATEKLGASSSGWLRNAPIGKKLGAVVALFVVTVGIQLGITLFALEVNDGLRAYIVGESLWSKAQKDSVIALRQYVRTGSETAHAQFHAAAEILTGLRDARLEMDKASFDAAMVHRAFERGGVHSEDARADEILLYRCCRTIGFVSRAMRIWVEADPEIDELIAIDAEAERRYAAGRMDDAYRSTALERVVLLNRQLDEQERRFSEILVDGANQIHLITVAVAVVLASLLLALALLLSWRTARHLRTGTANLRLGIEQLGSGNLGFRIPVASSDELGEIAGTLNALMKHTAEVTAEQWAATGALQKRSAELERANKELEQFAFATAHDLQTPLRGIVGFAQLLEHSLGERLGPSELDYLRGVVGGSLTMQRLVHSLLEYTRVSTQPDRHWTDLNVLLAEAKDELGTIIVDSGAQINSEPLPTLCVDARQIAQLLRSLLSNAIKFQTRRPPVVEVAAKRNGSAWIVSVADQGIGIEAKHHQRIFQIFQRLHTLDQYEGAGVGLSLSEKIIHNHGGRIWVESALERGSTFYFSLPDVEPPKRGIHNETQ